MRGAYRFQAMDVASPDTKGLRVFASLVDGLAALSLHKKGAEMAAPAPESINERPFVNAEEAIQWSSQ